MSANIPQDPYEYPQYPGVLRNKLNIYDAAELQAAETDLTAARINQLDTRPLPGRFDLAYLQAIHHYIFQDVYPWAGELRTIELAKGQSYFAHHRYLVSAAQTIFVRLKGEGFLRGLPHETFAEQMGYYLGELNALHPFREGNGRAQRMFLLFLARAAGFDLRWQRATQEQMVAASEASTLRGDNQGFVQMFVEIVVPLAQT